MPRSFKDSFDIGRTLSHGFSALKAAPLPLLVGSLLLQCTEGGNGGGNGGGGSGTSEGGEFDFKEQMDSFLNQIDGATIGVILVVIVLATLCLFAVLVFRSWLQCGYFRLHHEVLSTGQGQWGTLFGGGDGLKRMILWKLLKAFISMGTFLAAGAPGGVLLGLGVAQSSVPWMVTGGLLLVALGLPVSIYVGLGLWLGDRFVAMNGLGPWSALDQSWSMASGNRLWMLLYSVVLAIVHLGGLLLCCVGIILTRAIADVATSEGFLLFTRPEHETSGYQAMRSLP